jgi:hypothetical protein
MFLPELVVTVLQMYSFAYDAGVQSASPATGPNSGGTVVEVEGHNFVASEHLACKFGEILVPTTFVDASRVRCLSPDVSPSQDVTMELSVTNNGVDFSGQMGSFTFHPADYADALVVTVVVPSSGPFSAANAVSVHGYGFVDSGDLSCRFGDMFDTPAAFVSETEVRCTTLVLTGTSSVQEVTVQITNDGATFSNSGGVVAAARFTFMEVPFFVAAIAPGFGPVHGGTTVSVSGVNFQEADDLSCGFVFGDGHVAVVVGVYVSSTELECAAPPSPDNASVEVGLRVTMNTFTSVTDVTYTYLGGLPAIASVHPSNGPSVGGTAVVLTGTDFVYSPALVCKFGTSTVVKAALIDITHVQCTSPSFADVNIADGSMVAPVSVSTNGVDFSLLPLDGPTAFQYMVDVVTVGSISPVLGNVAGGTAVVVKGAGFLDTDALRCKFGAVLSPHAAVYQDEHTVVCYSPPRSSSHEETVAVSLTFNGVEYWGETLDFTYGALPMVTRTFPVSAPVGGGTNVMVYGRNFVSGDTLACRFNAGEPVVPARWISPTSIACTTPTGASVGVDFVEVTNNGAEFSSGSDVAFHFTQDVQVLSMAPVSGPMTGGTVVYLSADFDYFDDMTCKFGAHGFSQASVTGEDGQIMCVLPALVTAITEPLAVPLSMSNNGEDFIDTGLEFTYLPSMDLRSFLLTKDDAGHAVIQISGSGFVNGPALTCRFDGVPSPSTVFVSEEVITCQIPPSAVAGEEAKIDVSNNGVDYFGASDVFYSTQLTVVSANPQFGPWTGGTVVSIFTSLPRGSSESPVCAFSSAERAFEETSYGVWQGSFVECKSPAAPAVWDLPHTVTLHLKLHKNDVGGHETWFRYDPTAQVSAVAPSTGYVGGGTLVTFTGAHFRYAHSLTCRFGHRYTPATFVDAETVVCVSPPSPLGTVDTAVCMESRGCSSATGDAATSFTYMTMPHVQEVSPVVINFDGEQEVSVMGSGFVDSDATQCVFGAGTAAVRIPAVVQSSHLLHCTPPASIASLVDVDAETSLQMAVTTNGVDSSHSSVTLLQKSDGEIDMVVPNSGPVSGGTRVSVYNFGLYTRRSTCTFSAADGSGLAFDVEASRVSKDVIECVSPVVPQGGVYFITVDSLLPGVSSEEAAAEGTAFYYVADAQVMSLDPPSGSTHGGLLHVYGENFVFSSNLRCRFDSIVTSGTFVSDGEIMCPFPTMPAGTVDVLVSNNGADYEGQAVVFEYKEQPSVELVSSSSIVTSGQVLEIWVDSCDSSLQCVFGAPFDAVADGTCESASVLSCRTPEFTPALLSRTSASGVLYPVLSVQSGTNDFTAGSVVLQMRKSILLTHAFPAVTSFGKTTDVRVFGHNLLDDAECLFVGADASSTYTVNAFRVNGTTLSCVAPKSAAPGMYKLSVRNTGLLLASNEIDFVFKSQTAVTVLSPARGSIFGGTLVTAEGSGFILTQDLQCKFGTQTVSATFVGDGTITCISPPSPSTAAASTVAFWVSVNGVQYTEAAGVFEYVVLPRILSITPQTWATTDGGTITVHGEGFADAPTVGCSVGGTATPAAFVSDEAIACEVPASVFAEVGYGEEAPSFLDVEVTVNGVDFTADRAQLKVMNACEASAATPNSASVAGGTVVAMTGLDFHDSPLLTCMFEVDNNLYPVEAFWVSADRVECATPRIPSPAAVTLNGTVSASNNGVDFPAPVPFTFTPQETVSAVTPSLGSVSGGTKVQIEGLSDDVAVYSAGVMCRFGARLVTATIVDTTIECMTPAASDLGVVDVFVSLDDGVDYFDTLMKFEYVDTPIISSYLPRNGPVTGATVVEVTGENFFADNVLCRFGGVEGTTLFVSSTEVYCTTPPNLEGAMPLTVAKELGITADVSRHEFTFSHPIMVTKVRPQSVSEISGGTITVFGDNFMNSPELTCRFTGTRTEGDVDAVDFVFVSEGRWVSEIQTECSLPAFALEPGVFAMVVSNNGGRDVSETHTMTVLPASLVHEVRPSVGPMSGGTLVKVYGTNFVDVPDLRCLFGTHVVKAQFVSSNELACRSPQLNGGMVADMMGVDDSGASSVVVDLGITMSTPGIVRSASNATFEFASSTVLLSSGAVHGAVGSELVLEGLHMRDQSVTCWFEDVSVAATHLPPFLAQDGEDAVATMDRISCTVPAGEGMVSVRVSLEHSTVEIANGLEFSYQQLPQITRVLPTSVEEHSTAPIVLSGAGFAMSKELACVFEPLSELPASADGTPVGVVSHAAEWISEEEIQCQPPTSSVGTWKLSVSSAGTDGDRIVAAELVQVLPAASLVDLFPPVGFVEGGTVVNLYGVNFWNSAQAACDFDGKRVPAQFVDSGHLRCLVPAFETLYHNDSTIDSQGGVQVAATFNDQGFTNHLPFQYVSTPLVSAIKHVAQASSGDIDGAADANTFNITFGMAADAMYPLLPSAGSAGVLDGVNIECRFGKQGSTVVAGELVDANTVLCTDAAPYEPNYQYEQLAVVLSGYSALLPVDAIVTAHKAALPSIHLISPSGGPALGGTEVKLYGSGFQSAEFQCSFGDTPASETFVFSDKVAMCVVPVLTPGTYGVRVSGEGVEDADIPHALFKVWPLTTITAMAPLYGHRDGGTVVQIVGTSFEEAAVTQCVFGTVAVLANFKTPNEVECIAPAGSSTSEVALQVIVDGRVVVSDATVFTFMDTIRMTAVQPGSGWVHGGTLVTLTLAAAIPSSLALDLTCLFGETLATTSRLISEQEMECEAPATVDHGTDADAGVVSLSIVAKTGDARYVHLEGVSGPDASFAYEPVQRIVSISPERGPSSGGTLVEVTGVHLAPSSTLLCRFGDVDVPGRFLATNLVVCETPAYAGEGPVFVEVSQNGQEFSADGTAFEYYTVPEITSFSPGQSPLSGGTVVRVLGKNFGHANSTTVFCAFGGKVVAGSYISETELVCRSPVMNHAGDVSLEVSQDAHVFYSSPEGSAALSLFGYIVDPMVYTVKPSASVSHESAEVSVTGENFVADMSMKCKFGDLVVPATYRSSTLAVCQSPVLDWSEDVPVLVPFEFLINSMKAFGTGVNFQYNDVATIFAVEPNFAVEVGGSSVVVRGDHFVNSVGLKCRFDGLEVQASFVSSEVLSCDVPAHAPATVKFEITFNGLDYVQAQSPQFEGTIDSYVPFTYTPMVTMNGIAPTSGYTTGETSITVTGTGFLSASGRATCRFGGTVDVAASISSSTSLQCFSPPRTGSGVPMVVTLEISMDGLHFHALTDGQAATFEYVGVPSVTSVSPSRGPYGGGTVVEVTGTNFVGDMILCKFGEHVSAVMATVVSQARILCEAPAISEEGADIVDMTDDARFVGVEVSLNGLDFSSASNIRFEYEKRPSVFDASPQSGPELGGTTVTIRGMDFVESTDLTCLFGKESVPATFLSAMEIECLSPKHFPGATSIYVSNNGHDFSLEKSVQFAYHAELVVFGLSPASGPYTGGTDVFVRGTNYDFFPNLFCKFGDKVARATFVSAVEMKCTSPRHAMGEVVVRISANGIDFGDDASSAVFVFVPPPALMAIYPNRGIRSGGTIVNVEGRNFGGSKVVCRFEDSSSSLLSEQYITEATVQSSEALQCVSPAHPGGATTLEVSNNGVDFTSNGIVFFFESALSVTAIFPQAGAVDGATALSVHGTNFKNTQYLSCVFGDIAVSATWVSSTFLECTSPPMDAPGSVSVEVSNNAEEHSYNNVPFYYFGDGIVQGIHPAFGPPSGNTVVTVSGQNFFFSEDLECMFGGDISTQATFISASTIVCHTPPYPIGGVVDLRVSVKSERLSVNSVPFTYRAFPQIASLTPSTGPIYGSAGVDGGFQVVASLHFDDSGSGGTGSDAGNDDVKCLFGEHSTVAASKLNLTHYECELPPGQPGMTSFEMTFNGQDFTKSGARFTYQLSPQLTSLYPSHGPETGSTKLQVFATDISNTNNLKCRFMQMEAADEHVFAHQQTRVAGTAVHLVQAVPASRTEAWCNTPALEPGTYLVDLTVNDASFTANHLTYTSDVDVKVAEVSPVEGPSEGGTVVVVRGVHFLDSGRIVCMFGDEVTLAVFVSSSEIHCTTPMLLPGVVDVTVSMNGEDFTDTGIVVFSSLDAVALLDLFPAAGNFEGGTLVTITGEGFGAPGSAVQCRFGTARSAFAQVLSDASIQCEVPAFEALALTGHDAQSVAVAVAKNGVDFSSTSYNMQFQYRPVESISSIYPQAIPDDTNTTMTVLGSHFVDSQHLTVRVSRADGHEHGPMSMDFACRWASPGLAHCPVFFLEQLDSQDLLVQVSNNGADFTANAMQLKIYAQPEVHESTPPHGLVGGGTELTVFTSGLLSESGSLCCRFDHSVVPATRISDHSLSCVTPPHIAGEVPVEISMDGNFFFGSDTASFTFNRRPRLSSIGPVSGPVSGATTVAFYGQSLLGTNGETTLCYFGEDAEAVPATEQSASMVVCTSPPTAVVGVNVDRLVPVGISTNGGVDQHFEDGLQFQYQLDARVVALQPLRGPDIGGTELEFNGRHFVDSQNLVCKFTSTSLDSSSSSAPSETQVLATWISDTKVMCVTPALPPGDIHVDVSNNGFDFTGDAVLFEAYVAHKLTAVEPRSGSIFGGFEVFLYGEDFRDSSSAVCRFGSLLAPVAYVSATNVSCVAPPQQEGQVAVEYSLNGVDFTSHAVSFDYFAVPIVSSVSPQRGPAFGGTKVRVHGHNFVDGGVVCKIGALQAAAVEFLSESEIVCTTPPLSKAPAVDGCIGVECHQKYDFEYLAKAVTVFLASSPIVDHHAISGPIFTYTEPIHLRWMRPEFGPEAGNTALVVVGDDIPNDPALRCQFGDAADDATYPYTTVQAMYVNDTAVTCLTPAFHIGATPVSLVYGDDHVPLTTNTLEYTFARAARISTIAPAYGQRRGDTHVTVTGRHFEYSPHIKCRFGTATTASTVPGIFKSAQELLCVSPEMDVGPVVLEVSINGHDFTDDGLTFAFVEEARIYAVDPPFGRAIGGTVLTVSGEYFNVSAASADSLTCRFEGVADVKADLISNDQVLCVSPVHPTLSTGTVRVFVSVNGLDFSEEYGVFDYMPVEKVFAVSPKEVSSKGGTRIEIFGANFIPSLRLVCRFSVDGVGDVVVPAVVKTGNSVECTTPAVSPGRARITISNNEQEYSDDYAEIVFAEAISVTGIVPASSSRLGGTMVSIHGKHFSEEVNQCRFGSMHVPAIWLSPEEIRCSSPPHHPATVALAVTGNGLDYADSPVPFSFVAEGHEASPGRDRVMDEDFGDAHRNRASTAEFVRLRQGEGGWSVSELVPAFAGTAGGETITVLGTNFTDSRNIACAFGNIVVGGVFVSKSEIHCHTPRNAPATIPLEVSMDGLRWSYSDIPFTFVVNLAVNFISPTHGPSTGSTIVTVYGSHFEDTPLLRCRFGTVQTPVLEYVSSTQLRCLTPFSRDGPGAFAVEVTNNNLTYSDNFILYRYDDHSVISLINPVSGPAIGGTVVQVKGINFINTPELACKFGNVVVPAVFLLSVEILCTTPLHIMGSFPVEVTLNGADFTTSGIDYFFYDGPHVLSIWPTNGPAMVGGTAVTVHGAGFTQTTDLHCRFNQILQSATWLSDTQLICETPAAAPGLISFAVTNNRENWSPETVNFLYVRDATVAKLYPNRGFFAGQYPVFVTGSNFVNTTGLSCRFGGGDHSLDRSVRATFVSPRVVVCLAPEYSSRDANFDIATTSDLHNSRSAVTVEVTNNGLDYSTSNVAFMYISQVGDGEFRFGETTRLAPNGTYAHSTALGQANFTLCAPGSFQPRMGQKSCLPCPVGFHCPDHGMVHPVLCPAGLVCDETGLRIPHKVCPKGHYCFHGTKTADIDDFAWDTNAVSDEVTCMNQTRYFHNVNRAMSDTEYEIVGDGVYRGTGVCAGVNESEWPGPRGGFGGTAQWSSDYETEVLLFQPAARSWEWINRTAPATGVVKTEWAPDDDDVSHRCEHRRCEGRYLTRQRYVNDDNDGWYDPEFNPHPDAESATLDLTAERPYTCPMGHYCRSGAVAPEPVVKNFSHPQKCFDGFFCPRGSHSPEGTGACPTGYFCPSQTEAYICPLGQYCPGVGNIKPTDCYPGSFNPLVGQSNCTVCPTGHICPGWERLLPEICPAGFICVSQGLSVPVVECPPGYFCGEGTLTVDPSDTTPLRPMPCPKGTFCLGGVAHNVTIDWIPTVDVGKTSPQTCIEGRYCEAVSVSSEGMAPCFPGHYCPPGAYYPTEVPVGTFAAKEGSVASTLCFPGSYSPLKGGATCRVCPAGFTCQGYGTYIPSICQAGYYRSLADSVTCKLCPAGTWSPDTGLTTITGCQPCPPGRICGLQAMSNLVTSSSCSEGYACGEGTILFLNFRPQLSPSDFPPQLSFLKPSLPLQPSFLTCFPTFLPQLSPSNFSPSDDATDAVCARVPRGVFLRARHDAGTTVRQNLQGGVLLPARKQGKRERKEQMLGGLLLPEGHRERLAGGGKVSLRHVGPAWVRHVH